MSLASENDIAAVPCFAVGGGGAGRDLRCRDVATGESEYPCNIKVKVKCTLVQAVRPTGGVEV